LLWFLYLVFLTWSNEMKVIDVDLNLNGIYSSHQRVVTYPKFPCKRGVCGLFCQFLRWKSNIKTMFRLMEQKEAAK